MVNTFVPLCLGVFNHKGTKTRRGFAVDHYKTAESKFGKERADELRSEIEQLQAEIEKLLSVPLNIDDEP
jgi:hypothetical protein